MLLRNSIVIFLSLLVVHSETGHASSEGSENLRGSNVSAATEIKSNTLVELDTELNRNTFEAWILDHEKVYESLEEKMIRFKIWLENHGTNYLK